MSSRLLARTSDFGEASAFIRDSTTMQVRPREAVGGCGRGGGRGVGVGGGVWVGLRQETAREPFSDHSAAARTPTPI